LAKHAPIKKPLHPEDAGAWLKQVIQAWFTQPLIKGNLAARLPAENPH
jgi:hypothetical protein